jgi:hypothetical protein
MPHFIIETLREILRRHKKTIPPVSMLSLWRLPDLSRNGIVSQLETVKMAKMLKRILIPFPRMAKRPMMERSLEHLFSFFCAHARLICL